MPSQDPELLALSPEKTPEQDARADRQASRIVIDTVMSHIVSFGAGAVGGAAAAATAAGVVDLVPALYTVVNTGELDVQTTAGGALLTSVGGGTVAAIAHEIPKSRYFRATSMCAGALTSIAAIAFAITPGLHPANAENTATPTVAQASRQVAIMPTRAATPSSLTPQ